MSDERRRAIHGAESLVMILMLLGMALGNLEVAELRSTIPLALDGVLIDKETRTEKHPGRDDVHFLVLEQEGSADPRRLRVDQAVHDAVEISEHLRKERGETRLLAGDRNVQLRPSTDAEGMRPAMLLAGLPALLVAALFALRRRAGDSSS